MSIFNGFVVGRGIQICMLPMDDKILNTALNVLI